MPPSGGLNEEKPEGSKVWSLQPQPTTTVDGDKTFSRKGNAPDYQISKMEFNNFKDNLQSLWDILVGDGQQGPLVDQFLFYKGLNHIIDLSRTPRTYRRAATLRGLQPVTSFISVARRETTHDKITVLEQMMCKTSKGLFMHCYRYRQIDLDIWISCTESLGTWILSYPSLFLQYVYLMYFGLTSNDNVDDNVPSLGRFTRRSSIQMIALAADSDISVAISTTGLVKQLLRHQFLSRDIRHVIGPVEYEHLIAQKFNSSQFGAKGVSCQDHGTINIATRYEDFICVGVDSKLTNVSTGHVTNLSYNKFYQISRNIYITMAGLRIPWEDMCHWINSVFSTIPEELHTVELAANLAFQFDSPTGVMGSLVLGWNITSPHPQMFRVIAGVSLMTSDSAMALGTGELYINVRCLIENNYGELYEAFDDTMFLLNQACILDPFCGGIVRGWVLQRNEPPSCQYISSFN